MGFQQLISRQMAQVMRQLNTPQTRKPVAGTLAAVVGAGVAIALGTSIPHDESGRTVETTLNDDGSLAVQHVKGKQYLKVYLDIVGVATACDGITTYQGKPLPRDKTFTEAECSAMLEHELVIHAKGVMACTPGIALSDDPVIEKVREGPRFAAVSLGYNIGVGAYCRSTADKRFDARDYPGGCTALTWFNKAGGRTVNGLVKRRDREYQVCMNGLGALKEVYR